MTQSWALLIKCKKSISRRSIYQSTTPDCKFCTVLETVKSLTVRSIDLLTSYSEETDMADWTASLKN